MRSTTLMLGAIVIFTLSLFTVGCDQLDSVTNSSDSTKTGTGLFTTSGSMSFSSNRGDFSAQGIFDTLMTSPTGAGAFRFNITPNNNAVMLFAYNATTPTAVKVAFAMLVDTLGNVTTGTYSFTEGAGSKFAAFVYLPNAADTTSSGAAYELNAGSMSVTTLSQTTVAGTFSGSGANESNPTQAITVSNGSVNMPVVDYRFDFEDMGPTQRMVVERVIAIAQKEFKARN